MLYHHMRKVYRSLTPILWAKRNYKFFLASSFMDLDLKTKRSVLATNLFSGVVKPIQVKAPFGKRVLLIAPHHDDEAIGCGGSLLAHIDTGGEAEIIVVQDGTGAELIHGISAEELIDKREKESKNCAKFIGLNQPTFLRYKDITNENLHSLSSDLKNIILDYQPDTIFGPSCLDHNRHHMAISIALSKALITCSLNIDIFSYEVWGLCIPNVAVFIDDYIDMKIEMINLFQSQTQNNDYGHAFKGLAMFNSLQFGSIDTRYVERFLLLPKKEYIEFVGKIIEG